MRDRQGRADAAARNDLVLLGGRGRHELDDAGVDFKLGEVDGENAVLSAEQRRDLVVLGEAELAPVGLLVLEGFLKLRRGNTLLLEEQLADSDSHASLLRSRSGPTRWIDNKYYICDTSCQCMMLDLWVISEKWHKTPIQLTTERRGKPDVMTII